MEINGFEIDEYNVHKIKEGATTSTCPKCSKDRKKKTDKCLSVFWDTGLGQCNHCSETIQLHTYKKKETTKIYVKPILSHTNSGLSEQLINYAKEVRGVGESTLKTLKISQANEWMPKAKNVVDCILFNYYVDDELINIKYRAKNKDFKLYKDAEKVFYNLDSIRLSKECVIVEGEWDVASFVEDGYLATVSVPNGFTKEGTINLDYLDNYYDYFENKDKIYLAVDNDEAGLNGQKELIRRLGAEKCYLVDFKDCKDADEYSNKYGKGSLIKVLEDSKIVPLENVVTLNDVYDDLEDFWINGAPRGKTFDMGSLDDFASFEFKQHTLLVSAPNSGKSDLLDHFITKIALKYGDNIGICSTENVPLKFHYNKLFRKVRGLIPNKHNIKDKDVQEVKDFVNSKFYHYTTNGRYYLEDVLDKFAELVKRKGCRWFVIDPYNKIPLKNFSRADINAYTAEYHMQIDAFNQKYDTHIFLVAHPVKLPLKEGSSKTFIMPTAYNIKGGGEHFDMSYNILGMVRDFEHGLVKISTLKWKFQHLGSQGHDSWFGWNVNNGRYTPVDFDETSGEIPPNPNWDNTNWLTKEDNEYIKKPKQELKPLEVNDLFDDEDDNPF